MDVQEIGCRVDSIDVAQDGGRWRCVVTAVMYLQVPSNAGNFLPSPGNVTLSRRAMLHGVSYFLFDCVEILFPFLREYLKRRSRRVLCAGELKSLTQEIAVDLHRMDRVSQHWR